MQLPDEHALRADFGMVFDVQRFSLSDGPGIRTTVFLKGCPLSCLWCHNPESQGFRLQLSYDADRCRQCNACADVCPTGALTVVDGALVVERGLCNGCGTCVTACSQEALSIIGREVSAGEIIDEVLRDRAYFERSGGGITLSGGEPMAQPAFARALRQLARMHAPHTCPDTRAAAHVRRFYEALPFTDLFLYDYKATDARVHKRLVGIRNDLILANLEFLYESGAEIILRCPLVPGLNDSPDHLEAIAALDRRFPRLRGIEIMAYHNMGRAKSAHIGFVDPLADLRSADATIRQQWIDTLHSMGCTRAVLG